MKRINNIYDQICTPENLLLAYNKAKQGKGDTYGVRLFQKDLDKNLLKIHQELISCTFKTSGYSIFTIFEPKERIIYRLPFRDRVVHHAVMNILENIWVSVFISHSYSCIKGRGIHGVLRHIQRDLKDRKGTQYCLKMDIRKFYPNIDHEILKTIIRKKLKDKKVLKLLDEIIDSAPGVPIGNYLSQFFANLYLSYFDHWIKEEKQIKYYYRYADDIVILSPDKSILHRLLSEIIDYMNTRLNLQLKQNYQIFPLDARGIDFVGYVFRHDYTLMRKTIKKRFCRKVARLKNKQLDPAEYKMKISPWLGWAKHCNSKHLLKTILHETVL